LWQSFGLETDRSWAHIPIMADKHPKRPRDPNQLAKAIVDLATGEAQDAAPASSSKNPEAVNLGRLGGAKGGIARAASLSPEDRKRIAKDAALARWGKKPDRT
jgi:hypothetical protein